MKKILLTALCWMPFFVFAEPLNFNAMAKKCAKDIDVNTMQAIARTESSFNPYAIGVVSGSLKRQPENKAEAMAAVKELRRLGRNFSMGIAQVNVKNMAKYGLTDETIFDVCENLRVGSAILKDCFSRAIGDAQQRLQKALSCYYSGNFRTGFKSSDNYVLRVVNNAKLNNDAQTINPPKPLKTPKTQMVSVPKIDTAISVPSVAVAKKAKPKPKRQPEQATRTTIEEKQPHRREWDIFGEF